MPFRKEPDARRVIEPMHTARLRLNWIPELSRRQQEILVKLKQDYLIQ